MKIKYEQKLKERLKTGIHMFTGAGFSVLKSPQGTSLPLGSELSDEVIKVFNLKDIPQNMGLDYVSELCPEKEYQNFLRFRFTVESYNSLYDVLNHITIKTIVTTNIDNIIRKVIDSSNRYYLTNIKEYGAPMGGEGEIVYIPLHGEVSDNTSKLYFNRFELSSVDKDNSDLFQLMFSRLVKGPIIFLGYGFKDNGVLNVIKHLMEIGNPDIWVQVLPDDLLTKRIMEEKGCHIIEATTEEFLTWIKSSFDGKNDSPVRNISGDTVLKKYVIPTPTQVEKVPVNDFYQQGRTEWYPILLDYAYERKIVSQAEEYALKQKNVIFSGGKFTGKTTALMQLSRKVNKTNKFYVQGLTKEQATLLINRLNGEKAWIFFDNCCDDVDAYIALAKCENITLVGTVDEYQLETVKHILGPTINYKVINCNEIDFQEAKAFYNKIPGGIRTETFTYKETQDEKFSMLELIANNVKGAYTEQRISALLKYIKKENEGIFIIIALASYLSEHGSALSYYNVSDVLHINFYPESYDLVKQAENYLRLFDFIDLDKEMDNDCFVLRSKLFSLNVERVLLDSYKESFRKIVKKVVLDISPYRILRFDKFRRKGYDANLFKELFTKDEAVSLYDRIYQRDESPYTLQQLALCESLYGDHENAFRNIDKALSILPNNFSFKNSQAIIMFEANKDYGTVTAFDYMKKAMEILEQCYKDDKRKIYHAQKFAEFSMVLARDFDCCDYLKIAREWLKEIIEEEQGSRRTKYLLEKVSNMAAMKDA